MGLGGRMGVWDGGGRVVGIPCLDALRGCKKGCVHDEDGDSRGVDLVCRRVIMHPTLGLVLPHLRRSDMVQCAATFGICRPVLEHHAERLH